MPPATNGQANGTPMPGAGGRKRPAGSISGGDGSAKQRSGDTFDFTRLWDNEDADGAPAEVTGRDQGRSGGAPAAATPRQPVNLSSIIGSGSNSSRSKTTTPGSGSSSAASSRRPAGGSGSGSGGQSSAAGTRRSEAGDSLNEGPEDINELLGLIGDRLNKRFDTKKRKLESFAEKALSEAQKALQEHARQHYEAMEKKTGEHAQQLQALYAAVGAERGRLRQLQDGYQRTFATIMGKVEQLDNALQEEDERWAIEVQELNGASRQNLQTLENQLTNSLKSAREVLRNVGADQDDATSLKTSLQTMLAGF